MYRMCVFWYSVSVCSHLDSDNNLIIFLLLCISFGFFFFSSRRRHTRYIGDWSSDVCSSDLAALARGEVYHRVSPIAATRTIRTFPSRHGGSILFAQAARAIVPAPGTKGAVAAELYPTTVDVRCSLAVRETGPAHHRASRYPHGRGTAGRPPCEARSIGCSMREPPAIRCGIGRQDRLRRHAA